MEKLLNELRAKLLQSLVNTKGQEGTKTMSKFNNSLLLSLSETGVFQGKKENEQLFESASIEKNQLEIASFEEAIKEGFITECLKPTKKDYYFITLNGLYFIEAKKIPNLKAQLLDILQNYLYQANNWKLNDAEKIFATLLILFNAYSDENSFNVDETNGTKLWDFIKTKLGPGLAELGICNSFSSKLESTSTKYASAKAFLSGHLAHLTRSGLVNTKIGRYYLNINNKAEKEFLINLIFVGVGYMEKIKYIQLLESFGKELFLESMLDKKFVFEKEIKNLLEN